MGASILPGLDAGLGETVKDGALPFPFPRKQSENCAPQAHLESERQRSDDGPGAHDDMISIKVVSHR